MLEPATIRFSLRGRRVPVQAGARYDGAAALSPADSASLLVQEREHRLVELSRPLQRREMAHGRQNDQSSSRYDAREVLNVLALDELVVLADHRYDRCGDVGEIGRAVIRLRRHQLALRFGHRLERGWSIREAG